MAVVAMSAAASERSEVLVAKGELAYHRGQLSEARALLEQAVAADPSDAVAQLTLGQLLLQVGDQDEAVRAFGRATALDPGSDAARRGLAAARDDAAFASTPAERAGGTVGEIGRIANVRTDAAQRWGVTLTTGLQYDSNVPLEPHNRTGYGFGDKDDGAFVLSGGGHYDVVSRPDLLVRLEYDIYQTLHFELDDYNFRSQQFQGTISKSVHPNVWLGLQSGYNYYSLGPETYLGEPFVMPFVSILQGQWGLTQLNYRFGESTYFSTPFNGVRDGPSQSAGVRQDLFLDGDRYVTGGYQFTNENPSSSAGDDYQANASELYIGGGMPLLWEVYLDVQYLYRSDSYVHLNSFVDYRKKRQDDGSFFYAGISRPILPHVSVAIVYYGTINDSNVPVFEYQRHVVGTLLQVSY